MPQVRIELDEELYAVLERPRGQLLTREELGAERP